MFNKKNIKGKGRMIVINESLFTKIKNNRSRDNYRPKLWVFGLYERATIDQPKLLSFFHVEFKDALTFLNIIHNHFLSRTNTSIQQNAKNILDQTILEKNNTINQSIDSYLDFGKYPNENLSLDIIT